MRRKIDLDPALWRKRFEQAQNDGLSLRQFEKQHNISNATYYRLKKLINDEGLTKLSNATKRLAKPNISVKRELNYHKMPIEQPIVATPKSNPIFCLVVAFNSREEAFRAMGQL